MPSCDPVEPGPTNWTVVPGPDCVPVPDCIPGEPGLVALVVTVPDCVPVEPGPVALVVPAADCDAVPLVGAQDFVLVETDCVPTVLGLVCAPLLFACD